jgi:uncharacterized protein (DUF433 family)
MAIAFKYLAIGEHGDIEIGKTGVGVHNIFFQHELGETPEQLVEGFRIPLAAVYEALAYGAEHPEEMEAIRGINSRIEERGLREARELIKNRLAVP